ncbi:MAG: transglycosylase SLT domain-containing protein [Bacteroidetes bacterium]|uniref:Transglycosylase SLT domain-containing protein n=1 Tax=Candidatus Cryptobacteroides merdigallinarum TaxID=2840770 RepID=A0A9D9EJ06_9BACT|nr:transglycosylase SLT domain-containing protein [Candidatus Cryptobacteroides merdigallinarum]
MDILKHCALSFALAAIVPAIAPALSVPAAGEEWKSRDEVRNIQKVSKKKSELVKENIRLRSALDSLKAELEKSREEIRVIDSLSYELMDVYDENEDKSAAGLNPEDYNADVSDSLLSIWYMQQKISESSQDEYDMDSVRFESNVPDSVYIERIKAMNSFIDLPYNDVVRNYIVLYSEKMDAKMGQILGLCSYYMPIIEEIFDEHDIPLELKAMAVIESSLNPTAVSRAGAKGMWQFMYSTAKIYGLDINSFVDERLDPVKAAHAAAEYLKDSYNIFGDWNLAIASYNCGAGNVNRAIRRSGGKRAFWDIYPYLPRETRGYVPAFVGALYTMTYYKEHGIEPQPVAMPVHVDTFRINKMLHFKQVSELTGVPAGDLRNLNPQYKHDIVPGNDKEYILRIPYNYTNAFIDSEDSLYTYKAEEYFNPVVIKKIKDGGDGERIVHRVRSGEVLGKIAIRYRVSVSQIKRWNNLRSDNIRIGQRLVIYRGGTAPASTAFTASAKQEARPNPAGKSTVPMDADYTVYTVKSGDSLYLIAKDYPGVSAQNIMDFNGIGSNIKPGMKIRIPKL